MADYIPPEYAAQLAGLQRKKAISQALLQNSLASRPTEMAGNRAVKQTGLEAVVRALTGGVAGYSLGQNDEQEAGVMNQIAQARAQNLQGVLKDPDAGLVSADPRAQALAATILSRNDKRLEGFAGALKDRDPGTAARVFQTGELPTEPYEVPAIPATTFGVDEAGNRYSLTPNVKGDNDFSWAPKPMTIHNNAPAARDTAYRSVLPEVEKRQVDANLARDALAANRTAKEALNAGAQSGGGGEFFQAVRKVGSAIGFDPEAKVPTEQLAMALGNHILANARKLAPVTENDTALIKQIVGSLNTEPQNLARIFEIMDAASIRTLQNYGKYIDTATEKMPDEFGDMIRAMKIGYETPELSGNTTQAFRTLQELKARGGDPSQYRDPTGEQIPANARFDIRGLGLPKPVVPSKDPKKMTSDERAAEIQSLKAALAAAEAARAGK